MILNDPITEEWLKEVGFRWHQFDRQPNKQWLLWLGDSLWDGKGWCFSSYEDLGIELAYNQSSDDWFCWLRSDSAGRYHRFLHIRHLRVCGDVVNLITALTGANWRPENHVNGCVLRPENAEYRRREAARLDQRILRGNRKWFGVEEDDSRGRALSQHMQAAIDGGMAK